MQCSRVGRGAGRSPGWWPLLRVWRLGPKRVSEAGKEEEDVRTSLICAQFRFLEQSTLMEKEKPQLILTRNVWTGNPSGVIRSTFAKFSEQRDESHLHHTIHYNSSLLVSLHAAFTYARRSSCNRQKRGVYSESNGGVKPFVWDTHCVRHRFLIVT